MKKILLYLFVFICTVDLFPQSGNPQVEGYVFSENKPLAGANIIVQGTTIGTTTNKDGYYQLTNLPRGNFTLKASFIGYKAQEIEVKLSEHHISQINFDLEEDVLNLEQLVVTGTRTKHYIKDVPVRTEVITMQEIENKNACNLYQALEGIPGIRVEQQCQYCNFSMVRMEGLGAEHTQVLINGQPIYSGLAGVYGLQQMSTVDIAQIEVVKGAGSALYGSSAVAGAINIITKEPSFEPSTNIDIQLGNYNTNKYEISSSILNERGNIGLNIFAQKLTENAIDETGSGLTKDEVKKKDGISDRVASNLINAGFGLFFKDAFLNDDKLLINGKIIFEKRRGGSMTDDYFKNPFTEGTENIVTDRYETQLNYDKKFGIESKLNFSIAYANHNREATNDTYLNDYLATHNDSVPDVRNMRPYIAEENTLTSTLTFSTMLGKHNLLIGLQGFYDKLEESGMYVVVDPGSNYSGQSYKSIGNKSAREFGAFLQDEWAVTEKLMLVPGIRIDNHHSSEEYASDRQVFDSAFPKTNFKETSINPRLAIKYKVSEKVVLRVNAGTGFRAPYGFSEDLHLCSGSPRVWKSSDLKPETSISYNFSTDYYGEYIRISTNIFRTDLKNKIGFTKADPNVAALGYDYQWKNINDAFVQGIELSVQTNLVKNLDLGIDVAYNQGEYKNAREDWIGTKYESNSKYIPRFPITTGNLRIEYSPQEWSFSLTGNFQGNMYIDYYSEDPRFESKIKKTDTFMTFNARISKKLNSFKIYGGVNNIFNYIQDERHLDDAAFMYAPVYGTMFYCGISVEIKY